MPAAAADGTSGHQTDGRKGRRVVCRGREQARRRRRESKRRGGKVKRERETFVGRERALLLVSSAASSYAIHKFLSFVISSSAPFAPLLHLPGVAFPFSCSKASFSHTLAAFAIIKYQFTLPILSLHETHAVREVHTMRQERNFSPCKTVTCSSPVITFPCIRSWLRN